MSSSVPVSAVGNVQLRLSLGAKVPGSRTVAGTAVQNVVSLPIWNLRSRTFPGSAATVMRVLLSAASVPPFLDDEPPMDGGAGCLDARPPRELRLRDDDLFEDPR